MRNRFLNPRKYAGKAICYLKSRIARVNETPIIVLGNQKSGTSAIAHLLADYGGLSKTIDIPPLWGDDVFDIISGNKKFSTIVSNHRYYFSTDLIKEPNLTFFSRHVIERFPNARYVFVVRDPRTNIRSILNRMNIPGCFDSLPAQFLNTKMRKKILDASTWGGHRNENYVAALAHKWNRAVDGYLPYRHEIAFLKYEEFLIEKYEFIRQIATKLNIPFKKDIAAQLDVQFQPRGDHTVSSHEFFGQDNLVNIEKTCSARMYELGYST